MLEVRVHQFLDFKSFEEASLDLSRPFTILIGKNGSGKSNAIEGVEILAQIAQGRSLSEITDVGRSVSGFQVRGGLQACVRTGKNTFGLGFQGNVPIEGQLKPYTYRVYIQPLPEPNIQSERLDVDGRLAVKGQWQGDRYLVLYGDTLQQSDVHVSMARAAISGLSFSPDAVLHHVLDSTRDPLAGAGEGAPDVSALARYKALSGIIAHLRRELRAPFVFDPQPRLMRAYERIGNRVLARDGANVSAVLHALRTGSREEQDALTRILERIRQLHEEPFEEFDFVVTPLNDVLFGIRELKGGPIVDARLLSDGTLRCLALLTALETIEKGSRVIIEEFDNGLHPSRVSILTQAISEACERRELKVLVTTHKSSNPRWAYL